MQSVQATAAERIARFVADLRYDDLPAAVIDKARWIIADTIGCIFGGAATEIGDTVVRALQATGKPGASTIFGTGRSSDCVNAAFANSWLADILDYEDTLYGHPSATAVPAVLAVCEQTRASGRKAITAIVAGYEIGVRLYNAVLPTPARGAEIAVLHVWHGFCAAMGAAHALDLDAEQITDAIGYIGASTPLPLWYAKLGRPMHWLKGNYGEMTRAGVLAAFMARAGVRGPRTILDSDYGFWRMAGSDRFRSEALTAGLGEQWLILESEFKPYPACRYIHCAIDAALDIQREHAIPADEIRAIEVRSFTQMTDWFAARQPAGMIDAQFSVPYLLAVALLGVKPGPEWFSPTLLADPQVAALSKRVALVADAHWESRFWSDRLCGADVVVTSSSGMIRQARCDSARGSTVRPMSTEELRRKFCSLVAPRIGPRRAEQALGALLSISDSKDLSEPLALLVSPLPA